MRTNNDWFYDYFIDELKAIGKNCIQKLPSDLGQPDWNQNDNTQPDYIKNRPLIATDDDALDLLVGIGAITPITNLGGEILISSSNEIYYL